MPDIAVVDYGTGNLRSVAKALVHVAPQCTIVVSADPATIRSAERVVLPGQSAMPDCIRALDQSGLRDVVMKSADEPAAPGTDAAPAQSSAQLGGKTIEGEVTKETSTKV